MQGLDYSAIERARRAAREKGLTAEFRAADIFALAPGDIAFDTAILRRLPPVSRR